MVILSETKVGIDVKTVGMYCLIVLRGDDVPPIETNCDLSNK